MLQARYLMRQRDALTLARLHHAGERYFVHVPDEADEAIRDLAKGRCRALIGYYPIPFLSIFQSR